MVEWIDSHSGNRWQPIDELAAAAHPLYCRSVGWVVAKANGTLILVPHISGDGKDVREQGTGDIAIPIGAIKRTVRLRTPPHAPLP